MLLTWLGSIQLDPAGQQDLGRANAKRECKKFRDPKRPAGVMETQYGHSAGIGNAEHCLWVHLQQHSISKVYLPIMYMDISCVEELSMWATLCQALL